MKMDKEEIKMWLFAIIGGLTFTALFIAGLLGMIEIAWKIGIK
jgi:hypothetical protein